MSTFDLLSGGRVIVLEGDRSLLVEPDVQYNYKGYPALKIARLAVHEKYRDLKLGTVLV